MGEAKDEVNISEGYNLKSVDDWAKTMMEEEIFSFRWNILNFRKIYHTLPFEDALDSPEFVGGKTTRHTWILSIKKNKKTDNCFGLYLNLKKVGTPSESKKVFTGLKFSILGRNDELLFEQGDGRNSPKDFLESPSWGFMKFLSSEDLMDPEKGYIVDDQLNVHCRLWISKEMKSYKCSQEALNTPVEKKICEAFKELLETSICHDVIISTDTQEFKAHKCILSVRSSVFAAMFSTEMSEAINGKITISDFSDNIIQEMLSYMYSGVVENMKENAMELLRIADKYDIKDLKEDCIRVIPSTLTSENAVEILFTIEKYNLPKLKSKVIDYIIVNKDAMKNTTLFPDLVKDLFEAMGIIQCI